MKFPVMITSWFDASSGLYNEGSDNFNGFLSAEVCVFLAILD
jgi:hypothetical protein